MSPPIPSHLKLLIENILEENNLLDIHSNVAGNKPGRKYNVEVLNKSGIVLLVACWESYVEDVVTEAYKYLLHNAKTPDVLPIEVRLLASKELRETKDERKVWDLSGNGWKNVLDEYRKNQINSFNTPRSNNINKLYKYLLGIQNITASFRISRINNQDICKRLDSLVTLRGSIAHKVKTEDAVTKKMVGNYIKLINKLAENMNNIVNTYIKKLVGSEPWENIILELR